MAGHRNVKKYAKKVVTTFQTAKQKPFTEVNKKAECDSLHHPGNRNIKLSSVVMILENCTVNYVYQILHNTYSSFRRW
jgi:predicted Zn-dependent peptidase